ncbi:sulfotransferase [Rubrobacter taiwanensis]|uniref:Sulfotransferase n=1 Tax=Rubrobacter taiwanensis TaxID=185139 RepID=A0A4R1BEM9_9ACTN|nr:sulfotransferase [Rubrobacter taiwanensis]TCJ15543.1 sulfotransferase [Rubrobacter taiwanensis]
MTLPNFLIIGAQKAGTTSLYYYLRQHPQVYMSPEKETHFFTYLGERPVHGGPGRPATAIITDAEEYGRLFSGVAGEKAVGEASPSYLYSERAPERIKRYLPEARLIAILRQPAERAYSNFLHCLGSGREPLEDFAAALEAEDRRVAGGWGPLWHYRRKGYYHEQLSRYYALFDPAQIRVYLYEDLREDAGEVLRDIFEFLEVDESFEADTSERYNVSGVPRSRTVGALISGLGGVIPVARPILQKALPYGVRQRLKARIFATPPRLDPEVRRELTENYREDILRLEELIGRDLSGWLEV